MRISILLSVLFLTVAATAATCGNIQSVSDGGGGSGGDSAGGAGGGGGIGAGGAGGGAGGAAGAGGSVGADGAVTGCCSVDSDCGAGMECVLVDADGGPTTGVCKARPTAPYACWRYQDCPPGFGCALGLRVCPCLSACLVADVQGYCISGT